MIKKARSLFILMALSLLILYGFFPEIIQHPFQHFFVSSGDGIKNYYTPAFYVKYNSDTHFTGMNYPYGENIIFTDNQPLLSRALGWINRNITGISDNVPGIMNLLMLSSIIVCIFFLYLILKRLKLPDWYAIISAITIGFLSPQITRFLGHYALSYAFYIPMIWYLTIRFFEKPKEYLWPALILIGITVFAFIHVYYLAIGAFLVLTVTLVHALQNRAGFKSDRLFYLKAFIAATLPVLIFKSWLLMFDSITDRPEAPIGFLFYHATIEGVFLPPKGPFLDAWNYFIDVKKADIENSAYIGFAGTLCLLFSIFKAGRYLRWKQFKKVFRPVLPPMLQTGLWAGIILLLFSMGYPFRLWLDFLTDLIPPFKQFRSLGRFAWLFYYFFMVYAVYLVFLIYKSRRFKKQNVKAWAILIFALFSWGLAAFIHVNETGKIITHKDNKNATAFFEEKGNYKELLASAGYKPEDFQAIFPTPWFHIGSEKFGKFGSGSSISEAMKASYNIGLPIMANHISRTSLSQTLGLIQLISNPIIEKKILNQLPNNKPFLVIEDKHAPPKDKEWPVLNKARFIAENGSVILLKMEIDSFVCTKSQVRKQFYAIKDQLKKGPGFLTSGNPDNIVLLDFNDSRDTGNLCNNGIFYRKEKDTYEIYSGHLKPTGERDYEISFWIKADSREAAFPNFYFQQFDKQYNEIEKVEIKPGFYYDIYKDWVRVSHPFTLQQPGNTIRCTIKGIQINMEHFLIRPAGKSVYFEFNNDSTSFWFDNFPVVG